MSPVTPGQPIRVVLVDDHALVRAGVTALLAACDDIAVVAGVGDVDEVADLVADVAADVVVVKVQQPDGDGVLALRRLRDRHPDVEIAVLVGRASAGAGAAAAAVRAVVQAGARVCLLDTVEPPALAEAIRGLTRGRSTFSSELVPLLVGRAPADEPELVLTARERDILPLLAAGHTNRRIATALGLSEGTVRAHVSSIFTKLGVTNRTEASRVAITAGLVANT